MAMFSKVSAPAPAAFRSTAVLFSVIAYSACSSTMLIVNKFAIRELPVPTLVSGSQLLFSSCFVLALQALGLISMARPKRRVLEPFALYTTCFAAGIYANIKALELTSVGAVIAARSCLPLLVALVEWGFMGRQLPSARSSGALAGVLLAAGVYVSTDSTLSVNDLSGWAWLVVWFILLAFQMCYGKYLTEVNELSQHERVFYTNALSIPPTMLLCVAMGEVRAATSTVPSGAAVQWLAGSWMLGVGISYTGWRLKEQVSATTFTLVGVVNKMSTIVLSAIAFPGSTSAMGGTALVACILFGLLYRDAPMRNHGGHGRGPKARDSSHEQGTGTAQERMAPGESGYEGRRESV